MNEYVPPGIGAACFEDEDPLVRVGAQAIGKNAAGRASSNDDIVVVWIAHGSAFLRAAGHIIRLAVVPRREDRRCSRVASERLRYVGEP